MKPWRQISFVVLVLLTLANTNLVVPAAVHAGMELLTVGLALVLLFTVDWKVFKKSFSQNLLQELMVVVWVVVVGLNFLGYVGQMLHAGA